METLILHIGNKGVNGYPISLHEVSNGEPGAMLKQGQLEIEQVALFDAEKAFSAMTTEFATAQQTDEVGDQLFQVLRQSPIYDALQEYWDQHEQVRTMLSIDDEKLARWPWEFMCNGPLFHFQMEMQPFARGKLGRSRPSEPFCGVIRILLVSGQERPSLENRDADKIETAQELWSIRRLLNMNLKQQGHVIEMHELWGPFDHNALTDKVLDFRPHIFHFVGHGDMDSNNKPRLSLEDGYFDLTQMLNLLTKWRPQVALLNACLTGVAKGRCHSFAELFHERGTPAVLGMQAEVRGDKARELMTPFYEALLDGSPVDVALAMARQRLYEAIRHDWAVPALYLNSLPEFILPFKQVRANKIASIPEFITNRVFIDRQAARQELTSLMLQAGSTQPRSDQRLLVIDGVKEVGKTWFFHYCLEAWVRGGWDLAAVNMGDKSTWNYLRVLRAIRDGDSKGLASVADDATIYSRKPQAEAFCHFNHQLNHLAKRGSPRGVPDCPPGIVEERAPFREQGDPRLIPHISEFSEHYRKGLEDHYRPKPLLIAIDHFNLDESDFEDYFIPYLLQPLLNDPQGNIFFLISMDSAKTGYLDRLKNKCNAQRLNLPAFSKKNASWLILEFLFHHKESLSSDYLDAIPVIAKLMKENWLPKKFLSIGDFLELDISGGQS